MGPLRAGPDERADARTATAAAGDADGNRHRHDRLRTVHGFSLLQVWVGSLARWPLKGIDPSPTAAGLADARPGGQVPRRRPEHDPQMVRPGPLPAFYTPGGHRRYRRARPRPVPRALGPAARRARARPLVLIVDDDDRLREFVRVNLEMEGYMVREAGERRGGAGGARRGVAGPDPARRDDAAGRRLGDAAAGAGAPRRRRDPGDHVQRQGRRADGAARRSRAARRASSASRSTRSTLIESTKQPAVPVDAPTAPVR